METSSALIGIVIALTLGWVGWVSMTLINNSNKISAFLASHNQLHADNQRIEGMIKDLNTRFDLFLKTEIDSLKQIAKNKD